MLKILQKLQNTRPTTQLVIVLVAALLWFLPDICGRPPIASDVPFVLLNKFTIFSLPAFWSHTLQFFCLVVIAFSVLYVGRSSAVIPKRSSIQLVVLLTAVAATWRVQYFGATTVAFIFFLMANSQMISMYGQKHECVKQAFNSAFFIVLATMFDRTFIIFLLIVLVGMAIFGSLTLRTICAFLAGLFMPIALLIGSLVYADSLESLTGFTEIRQLLNYTDTTFIYLSNVAFVVVLILCYVFSLVAFMASSATQNLDIRLNYQFVNCSFLIAVIVSILFVRVGLLTICPIYFGSLIVSFYFVINDRSRVANVLFWLLLVAAIGSRVAMILGF